jgi:hypothetical protein
MELADTSPIIQKEPKTSEYVMDLHLFLSGLNIADNTLALEEWRTQSLCFQIRRW